MLVMLSASQQCLKWTTQPARGGKRLLNDTFGVRMNVFKFKFVYKPTMSKIELTWLYQLLFSQKKEIYGFNLRKGCLI